jgi:hypothetical protein
MIEYKILSTPMEKGMKLLTKTDSNAINELCYELHFLIYDNAKGRALDCSKEGVKICERVT